MQHYYMSINQQSEQGGFPPARHDHAACRQQALTAADRVCQEAGLRLTRQRRQVLEVLLDDHRPYGAYEIREIMVAAGLKVQAVQVYRALSFLEELGLVHRIESLNAYVACGHPGATHAGHFLICNRCRRVAELEAPSVDRAIDKAAGEAGFRVEARTVEVSGTCPACRGIAE